MENKELNDVIEEKTKKLAMSDKLVRPEKKIMMCALYLMFYRDRPRIFVRDMSLGKVIFDAWLSVYKGKAEELLQTYKDGVKKDVMEELGMTINDAPVPTPDSIKSKILIKLNDVVMNESDPAKLAGALKVLDKYEKDEKEVKKSKKASIYDDLKNI